MKQERPEILIFDHKLFSFSLIYYTCHFLLRVDILGEIFMLHMTLSWSR